MVLGRVRRLQGQGARGGGRRPESNRSPGNLPGTCQSRRAVAVVSEASIGVPPSGVLAYPGLPVAYQALWGWMPDNGRDGIWLLHLQKGTGQ
jgi:hypothetical protein